MRIKVKYHYRDMPRLKRIVVGDWIDLYAVDIINLPARRFLEQDQAFYVDKGDFLKVDLGVSIELPPGFEAWIVPRSSLFVKTGLIMVNSPAIIDNSYCGDDDRWHALLFCTKRWMFLKKHARICQFRIVPNMPSFDIVEVDVLHNKNRGGIGSTGD